MENRALARMVTEKRQPECSPRHIAGWLKRRYPGEKTFQESRETIYCSLCIQARDDLKKEFYST